MMSADSTAATCDFRFRNGYFSDERRSPRGFSFNVHEVRLKKNRLCGLAHQKNFSFLNRKSISMFHRAIKKSTNLIL
jgi:hypothetical protein